MSFKDIFGNDLQCGDFIAYGSSGQQLYMVEKMFFDKRGYKKLRVTPVLLDPSAVGGFTVGTKKKYVYDTVQPDKTANSKHIILLKRS